MIAHRRWLGITTREWLKESDTPQGLFAVEGVVGVGASLPG